MDRQRAVFQVWADHIPFVAATSIRDKGGNQVPLILSPGQIKLHQAIQRQEQRGEPIRVVVLKARQTHFSVGCTAELWRRVAFLRGQKARVYADVSDNTRNLYGYWEQMISHYRMVEGLGQLALLDKGQWTNELISFEGGGMVDFGSAERATGGRSHAVRYLHLSEFAFWRDARTLMVGLMASVPYEPETMVIVESTANGLGGPYYDLWRQAYDRQGKDEHAWAPVFFAWHEHPEYRIAVQDPDKFQASMTDEEWTLQQRYSLHLEQLAWRRVKIATDYSGDPRGFAQEFPGNPEEAFLTSGSPRFYLPAIQRLPRREDAVTGHLERVQVGTLQRLQFLSQADGRGPLKVYRRPVEGEAYVLGIDVAEGIDASAGKGSRDSDFSVAHVLNAHTGEQAAVLRGRFEPAVFAQMVYDLGQWFGWAWMVPEANGPGLAFLGEVMRLQYPITRIYHRKRDPDDRRTPLLQELGWKTTSTSRPDLLSRLDRALLEGALQVYDPITVGELQTFVVLPNGRAEASEGAHDDCVIALALCVVGIDTMPRLTLGKQERHPWRPVKWTSATRRTRVGEDDD
jgi:hypothetical protein